MALQGSSKVHKGTRSQQSTLPPSPDWVRIYFPSPDQLSPQAMVMFVLQGKEKSSPRKKRSPQPITDLACRSFALYICILKSSVMIFFFNFFFYLKHPLMFPVGRKEIHKMKCIFTGEKSIFPLFLSWLYLLMLTVASSRKADILPIFFLIKCSIFCL